MSTLYLGLLLLHVYSSVISVTALDVNWSSNRRGVQFDDTCTPYRVQLNNAVIGAVNLALAGHSAASSPSDPIFESFFRKEDAPTVRRTFTNVKEALEGRKRHVTVQCIEDEVCSMYPAVGYADFTGSPARINLCKHSLDGGPQTKPALNDYCNPALDNSLDETLLHELIHIPQIGPPIPKGTEEVYHLLECIQLTAGKTKDSNGDIMLPVNNPASYAHVAAETIYYLFRDDPKRCPQNTKTELRKLKGSSDVTSLADGSVEPLDIAANATLLKPSDFKIPAKNETELFNELYASSQGNESSQVFIPPITANTTDDP